MPIPGSPLTTTTAGPPARGPRPPGSALGEAGDQLPRAVPARPPCRSDARRRAGSPRSASPNYVVSTIPPASGADQARRMQSIKPRLALAVLPALVLASLAFASPAFAVERFAAPGGPASGTCLTEGTACDLEFAVENAAVDGDVVSVLPGSYTETNGHLRHDRGRDPRRLPDQPMPTLTSTVAARSHRDQQPQRGRSGGCRVVHNPPSGSVSAVQIDDGGGTIEQVIASTTSPTGSAAGCGTVNAVSGDVSGHDLLSHDRWRSRD